MVNLRHSQKTYHVYDNSGIVKVKGINLSPGGSLNGPAWVLGTTTKVVPNKKVHRGDLVNLLVSGTTLSRCHLTGTTVKCNQNVALGVKISGRGDKTPLGTRQWGPMWLEIAWWNRGGTRFNLSGGGSLTL